MIDCSSDVIHWVFSFIDKSVHQRSEAELERQQGVDALRVVAIIAVIVIHTNPFMDRFAPPGTTFDFAAVLIQAARFAVPYFFILSGYFWAKKVNSELGVIKPTVAMGKRIGVLFLAWTVIYMLPTNLIDSFDHGLIGPIKQLYWNVGNIGARPADMAWQGSKGHLWFLIGLLCSLGMSALLVQLDCRRLLVVLAVSLYFIGLAGKAYSATPVGLQAGFEFRNGLFLSPIFFVTGYFLQRRKPASVWFPAGLAIAVSGFVLQMCESWVLHTKWGTPLNQDYFIGTYFFGLGVALVALSNSRHLHWSRAAAIGPLVLGIYASHMVFIDVFKPLDRLLAHSGIWQVAYVAVVFVLSYCLARILSQYSLTKRLVA